MVISEWSSGKMVINDWSSGTNMISDWSSGRMVISNWSLALQPALTGFVIRLFSETKSLMRYKKSPNLSSH